MLNYIFSFELSKKKSNILSTFYIQIYIRKHTKYSIYSSKKSTNHIETSKDRARAKTLSPPIHRSDSRKPNFPPSRQNLTRILIHKKAHPVGDHPPSLQPHPGRQSLNKDKSATADRHQQVIVAHLHNSVLPLFARPPPTRRPPAHNGPLINGRAFRELPPFLILTCQLMAPLWLDSHLSAGCFPVCVVSGLDRLSRPWWILVLIGDGFN